MSQPASTSLLFLERLHAALNENLPKSPELTTDALKQLMQLWATEFDRGEKIDSNTAFNSSHVAGMALSVLFSRQPQLKNVSNSDIKHLLGPFADSVVLTDKNVSEYRFEDVQSILTAIQLEFHHMYIMNKDGFLTRVDMLSLCMTLLAQAGHWIGLKWHADNSEESTIVQDEALRGIVDIDNNAWAKLRSETIVFFLDAFHSVLGLHLLLSQAQFVPSTGDLVDVTAHHREASNETFFVHSMTADCMVGSVIQYAHKFAYLFHSISQAVYYNRPSYHRERQISLQKLQERNARHVNILSLLTELHPDIPVLYEHTGAGFRQKHAQQKYAWVLWSQFVLLVDSQLNAYAAQDLRTLLTLLDS